MSVKVPVIKMSIKADEAKKQATINIEGEIGWVDWDGEKYNYNTSAAIRRQLAELMDMDVDTITVNIHSLGGYVDDALAIHDALAMHPANIITNVTGFTASSATIIAQAGNTRTISANAMYLIHEAWGVFWGTVKQVTDQLETLVTVNGRLVGIYAKRGGKDEDYYKDIMGEKDGSGKWITAEQALEFGLVDEIIEPMALAAASTEIINAKAFGISLPEGVEVPEEEQPKNVQPLPIAEQKEVRTYDYAAKQREIEILTLT
jgi:ATP-dependent Clp protease protease subunit